MNHPRRLAEFAASDRARSLFMALSLLAFGLLWGHVIYKTATDRFLQWDFRTYYNAAERYESGGDIYAVAAATEVASEGLEARFPYVYPYYTVHLFRPFVAIGLNASSYLFLALKLAAVAGLFYIWRRYYPPGYVLPAMLFCSLAYRQAMRVDVIFGNISTFEQLALWIGVGFFLRDRIGWFYSLITASALLKLNTIALLMIAPFERRRSAMGWALGCLALFLGVIVVTYIADPEAYASFFRNLTMLDERGSHNPSSFALIADVVDFIRAKTGLALWRVELALYGVYVTVLLGWTRRMLKGKGSLGNDPLSLIVVAFFLYGLVMPRFKDYSYILVVIPSLHVLRYAIRSTVGRVAAVAVICVPLFGYQLLMAAAGMFVAYIRWLGSQKFEEAKTAVT